MKILIILSLFTIINFAVLNSDALTIRNNSNSTTDVSIRTIDPISGNLKLCLQKDGNLPKILKGEKVDITNKFADPGCITKIYELTLTGAQPCYNETTPKNFTKDVCFLENNKCSCK